MSGSPVHIIRGEWANTYGFIKSAKFDERIQNATYTIRIPGTANDYYVEYYATEPTYDQYVTVPTSDCAIYHPVGRHVRVRSGGYEGYTGIVTACKYDTDERCYHISFTINAEQFPCHPMDYLPSDVHLTLPGNMLAS